MSWQHHPLIPRRYKRVNTFTRTSNLLILSTLNISWMPKSELSTPYLSSTHFQAVFRICRFCSMNKTTLSFTLSLKSVIKSVSSRCNVPAHPFDVALGVPSSWMGNGSRRNTLESPGRQIFRSSTSLRPLNFQSNTNPALLNPREQPHSSTPENNLHSSTYILIFNTSSSSIDE
jgi:hypothetical protein